MHTKEVMEAMMYKIPNLKYPLMDLGILDKSRMFSSVYRREFDNILREFDENLKIITVYSIMQTMFIFQKIKGTKKFKIIKTSGKYTIILKLSKSGLVSEIMNAFYQKHFLPEAFQNKIALVNSFDSNGSYGIVFSQYGTNEWSIRNPLELSLDNVGRSISTKNLVTELVYGIMKEYEYKEEKK